MTGVVVAESSTDDAVALEAIASVPLLPEPVDGWEGVFDPELARLAIAIADRQAVIDEYEALMAGDRKALQARLEALELANFDCPVGVFRLARVPEKLVVEVPPEDLPSRFQKVSPDVKAIRQALLLDFPVPAHLEERDREFRLVVSLSV